eukprot:CAMPEP_0114331636 /NCGR_PEP_ID=MMETSP0101-20121206/2544_1 /TAXON_ID=38822 ORGANISM="Pteridomonas danica, Strain PT" /NCGR_SAMPLE_ID=MMETSP0101 /ASSEMBLY_ACC=CAM_ASM_000211 /LENGTH=579 /DNA_ID=CAMNT_0001462035 /DNA_START=18 /DNA_END=1758 /DNA_ORIENTATION=+
MSALNEEVEVEESFKALGLVDELGDGTEDNEVRTDIIDPTNPWFMPKLDKGWHPQSGSIEERRLALETYKLDISTLSIDDMTGWYSGDSPWHAGTVPHKWVFEKMETLKIGKTKKSFSKSISKISKSTYLFYMTHFEESTRYIMGEKTTRWLVCCYLSPTTRLYVVSMGFRSKDEILFPFALQTLKKFTVLDDDNDSDVARGFTYRSRLGVPEPGCLCVLGGKRKFGFELQSDFRGNLDISLEYVPFKYLNQLGPGFYNLRTQFKVYGGILDLGNHMSFLRLKSGRFLAIDAVDPIGTAAEGSGGQDLKAEIDRLTEGGRLIEAVVATHPFHTLGFEPFYNVYGGKGNIPITETASPSSSGGAGGGGGGGDVDVYPKWYGTPRHLRRINQIPWTASVTDCRGVMSYWEADGIFMRIPDGGEFANPKPPTTNHFSNVFVFHEPSRTIHNDDTLLYFDNPISKMGLVAAAIPGLRHDKLCFHTSMPHDGLTKAATSPAAFVAWLEKLLNDWDFENLASAHNGVLIGGANRRVRELLDENRDLFAKLTDDRLNGVVENVDDDDAIRRGAWSKDMTENNCECG